MMLIPVIQGDKITLTAQNVHDERALELMSAEGRSLSITAERDPSGRSRIIIELQNLSKKKGT